MVKHLLKAFGILAILLLSSNDLSAQTTFYIKNQNRDCVVSYDVRYSSTECVTTGPSITGTVSAGTVASITIPAGSVVWGILITDTDNSNSVWVYDSNCGSTTGSYTNCDNVTSDVEYTAAADQVDITQ